MVTLRPELSDGFFFKEGEFGEIYCGLIIIVFLYVKWMCWQAIRLYLM